MSYVKRAKLRRDEYFMDHKNSRKYCIQRESKGLKISQMSGMFNGSLNCANHSSMFRIKTLQLRDIFN